jgi:hypothetical protein
MSKWESLSGELFKEIFSLDCFVTDSDYFSFLELPYQELEQCINSESPSVGHMHVNFTTEDIFIIYSSSEGRSVKHIIFSTMKLIVIIFHEP